MNIFWKKIHKVKIDFTPQEGITPLLVAKIMKWWVTCNIWNGAMFDVASYSHLIEEIPNEQFPHLTFYDVEYDEHRVIFRRRNYKQTEWKPR
jgi:hypothetical protein